MISTLVTRSEIRLFLYSIGVKNIDTKTFGYLKIVCTFAAVNTNNKLKAIDYGKERKKKTTGM